MAENSQVAMHVAALAPTDDLAIASITRGEILYGAVRLLPSKRRSEIETKAATLFSQVLCLPVTEAVADAYADIKAALEKAGRPIGKENDLWIAAVACAYGCVLVSAQTSFSYVPELQVENWTQATDSEPANMQTRKRRAATTDHRRKPLMLIPERSKGIELL